MQLPGFPNRARQRVLAIIAVAATAIPLSAVQPASAAVPGLESAFTSFSTQSIGANFIFSRGQNLGTLYGAANIAASDFLNFVALGGPQIVGDPRGVGTFDGPRVFVRGTDNQVYTALVRNFNLSEFTGFQPLPGVAATSEIAPVALPNGDVRIFTRDDNGTIVSNLLIFNTGTWTGWSRLKGDFVASEITASLGFFPQTFSEPGLPGQSIRLLYRNVSQGVSTFLVGLDGTVTPTIIVSGNGFADSNISHFVATDMIAYRARTTVFVIDLQGLGRGASIQGSARYDPSLNIRTDGSTSVHVLGSNNNVHVYSRPAGGGTFTDRNIGGFTAWGNPIANSNGVNVEDIFVLGGRGKFLLNRLYGNGNYTGFNDVFLGQLHK